MATDQTRGQVIRKRFTSTVLADNPLGDPAERDLIMYLPPGYANEPERRYPVIFVLAGFMSSGASLVNFQPFQPTIAQRMDALIAREGSDFAAILVLPDCFTSYGGSQYVDSAAVGNYASYLYELVAHVDDSYRTLGASGRGIMGKSSGGFGSLHHAMNRPDVWSAVACHSGDMNFDFCYGRDFPRLANVLHRAGGAKPWLEAFNAQVKKRGEDMEAMGVFAMAACYSPNLALDPPVDLPIDIETCERIPAVWERWLTFDPVQHIQQADVQQALRSLKLLYFECGWHDDYNLHFGARIFRRHLAQLQIAHEYQEFDDGHGNTSYRYDVSLPKMIQALRTPTASS